MFSKVNQILNLILLPDQSDHIDLPKGASLNYVDKQGGGGVCQMSMLVNEGEGESWSSQRWQINIIF